MDCRTFSSPEFFSQTEYFDCLIEAQVAKQALLCLNTFQCVDNLYMGMAEHIRRLTNVHSKNIGTEFIVKSLSKEVFECQLFNYTEFSWNRTRERIEATL